MAGKSKRNEVVTVYELKDMLDEEGNFILIDVREPEEFEICHIDGAVLVPLSEIEEHLEDFDPERQYIVHCKSGKRSEEAIKIMKGKGFGFLKNLEGGILSWADNIEMKMEKY